MTASKEEIQNFLETAQLSSYQRISLPYGFEIPGKDHSKKINTVFNENLEGKSVLDVGCYYGLYSHEAKKRGAGKVVGIEINEKRAETAIEISRLIGDGVEILCADIMDVYLEIKFDLVLFLSVLHHVKNPLSVIQRLAAQCSDTLVVEFCLPEHRLRRINQTRKAAGNPWSEKLNDYFRKFLIKRLGERAGIIVTGDLISGDRDYDWTFFFNETAFRTIFQVQNKLFSNVRFVPSPQKEHRMLAFCKILSSSQSS
jgi:SAM-dependent methyltransferase